LKKENEEEERNKKKKGKRKEQKKKNFPSLIFSFESIASGFFLFHIISIPISIYL